MFNPDIHLASKLTNFGIVLTFCAILMLCFNLTRRWYATIIALGGVLLHLVAACFWHSEWFATLVSLFWTIGFGISPLFVSIPALIYCSKK